MIQSGKLALYVTMGPLVAGGLSHVTRTDVVDSGTTRRLIGASGTSATRTVVSTIYAVHAKIFIHHRKRHVTRGGLALQIGPG